MDIHRDTAKEYGINDGDMVIVESKRGTIEIKARVSEDIVPGAVHITHGWSEANINALINDADGDPVSGYPALKSSLCSIRKKGGIKLLRGDIS